MKQQMNVRVPNITSWQIEKMCLQQNMTKGEIVTLATDRLYGTLPQPKCFYISGDNGSYIELEDGRYADTVAGDTNVGNDAQATLEILLSIDTIDSDEATWEHWSHWDNEQMSIREYVGA